MLTAEGLRPTIATERFSCRIDAERGTYSVYNIRSNMFTIESASMAIVPPRASGSPPIFLGETLCFNKEYSVIEPGRLQLRYNHPQFPFYALAEFAIVPGDDNALTIRLSFANRGNHPIRVNAICPLWVHPSRDGSIELGGSWSHASMMINGLDSESESRIEFFSKPDGTVYESHGFTLLYNLLSHQDLFMGFETADAQFSRVIFSPRTDGMLVQAISEADDASVGPKETMHGETLLIRVGEPPRDLLDAYMRRMAEGRHFEPKSMETVSGWSTEGLCLPGALTESDVLENVAWLHKRRDSMPVEHVLIHNGWQAQIGEWFEPAVGRFDEGMASVAEKIKSAGLKPAIWLAPLLAHPDSKFFDEHRSWFLKDVKGSLLRANRKDLGGSCYILDTTHPDALAWVQELVRTICIDWGFKYLQLDCLSFLTHGGQFKDPAATRMDAYHRCMEAIRAGAGDDVILHALEAPLNASVGLVDIWRTGPEMTPAWHETGETGIRVPGRNSLLRSATRGKFWRTDMGPIALSTPDLTDSEEQVLDSLAAICSDTRIIRGALADLAPEQLDHARFLLGGPAPDDGYVPNMMERASVPNHYVLTYGNRKLVAIFDWDESDEQIYFPLEHIGAEPWDAFVAYNVWDKKVEDANIREDYIARNVHPHSCRLLHFVPMPTDDTPVLIGSTLHYSQGAHEVVKWERDGKSLHIELNCSAWIGRSGKLTLYRRGPSTVELASFTGASDVTLVSEVMTGGQAITVELGKIEAGRVGLEIGM